VQLVVSAEPPVFQQTVFRLESAHNATICVSQQEKWNNYLKTMDY